jgi:hypothetical protein
MKLAKLCSNLKLLRLSSLGTAQVPFWSATFPSDPPTIPRALPIPAQGGVYALDLSPRLP